MEITSVFCDVHTSSVMKEKDFLASLDGGMSRTDIHAMVCEIPGCKRCYRRRIHGYHDFGVGYLNIGDDSRKLKCDKDHDEYLALTKIDGVLTWACPDTDCTRTQPYEEVPA